MEVDVHDPWGDPGEYGLQLVAQPAASAYDRILLAVTNTKCLERGIGALHGYGTPGHVFFGRKSVCDSDTWDVRL
jgi:hypothetical protein